MNRWLALVLTQQQQLAGAVALEPDTELDVWTEEMLIAHIVETATVYGLPAETLLALAYAESRVQQFARRPPYPAQDLEYWTDVSMGLYQQTVRWANEYAAWCANHGHDPDAFPGAAVIAAIGTPYYDPPYASAVAAPQLADYYHGEAGGDSLAALALYNWPAGGGAFKSPEHEQNYTEALAWAQELLS